MSLMAVHSGESFKLPNFYNYPPYFTLQPVRDTREKQVQLWKELILQYCKAHKISVVNLEEEFPLFVNPTIERKLNNEAREVFLGALVAEGRGEWLDKSHRRCLILWRRIQDWADWILQFVRDNGLGDSVMTLEEIRSGDETRGSGMPSLPRLVEEDKAPPAPEEWFVAEIEGIDRTILTRALKILEQRGKAAVFTGASTDDEGVKFSA